MTPEINRRIEHLRRSDIPDGYKKTSAGILPAAWDVYILEDCLSRVERPVEVNPNQLYTQIGIRSHGKGLFYKEPVTGSVLGNKAVFWIEPDCFIVNIGYSCAGVPLFRRNGYRQSSGRKPLFRNRDTALN